MTLQVFISYKRKYEDFAREVKEQIHAWGYGTWFDRDDIPDGTYFRHAIQKGLETSEVMVGVLTEEAIQSREVQAEWDYFFIKNKDFIPLRYQAIEPPYHLLTIQYIDFIENRTLAFEKLKHRLSELAASRQPAPAETEQKPEPQPVEVSEYSGTVPPPITLSDFIDDKVIDSLDSRNLELLKEQIKPLLGELRDRERFVLEMRFGLSDGKMHTLYEIAQVAGVAHERIRQLEAMALRKLRRSSGDHEISEPSPTTPSGETVEAQKRDQAASTEPVGSIADKEAESLYDLLESDQDEIAVPPAAESPPREPLKPAPAVVPAPAAPKPPPAPMQQAPGAPPASPSLYTERGPGGEVLMPQPAPRKSGSRLPVWALDGVAALIVVVLGAAVLFSTSIDTSGNPPDTFARPEFTSPLLLLLGALVVGAVGVFAWRRSRSRSVGAAASVSPTTELANRRIMLDKVEEFWIRGVLDKALEAGQFEMGLAAAPGAVLRHVDYGDYPLPPNASIAQIFEDLNRELLILGAPGGGKTVLLLQLAKALIDQARNPHPPTPSPSGRGGVEQAIPVVFNLSSWAAGRKPLAEWLVDELRLKYQVTKKVAQAWMEHEQILPLLDGLDEVVEQYRNDCVAAINAFRQQYRAVDMAVCSRIADYDLLTSKLDVRGAVTLQPLDDDQINRYLDRSDLDGLRQVMLDDAELRDMTRTPFLLNTMAYAYAGASPTQLQLPRSDDMGKARRTHLFDRLVEKRLIAHSHEQYTPRQVRTWLGWLAGKMTEFKHTTFYIEGLQTEWIKDVSQLYLYKFIPIAIGAFMGGMWFLLREQSLMQLALGGIIGGLLGSSIGRGEILALEQIKWSHEGAIISLKMIKKSFWLNVGIFAIFATIAVWLNSKEIIPGIIVGVITFIVGVTIPVLLGGVLYHNFASLHIRTDPNQGMFKTIRYGLASLGIFIAWQIILSRMLGIYFLFVFLLFGYVWVAVLQIGLGSSIRHILLRFILWRSGDAPLNYARFLDYCARAGLLRKVGGGYIFVHRYLLEYFAESSG